MARGYSRDLRERLLQAVTSGLSLGEIARTTGVSPSSLCRWQRKQINGVSLEPGHSDTPERAVCRAVFHDSPGEHLADTREILEFLNGGRVDVQQTIARAAADSGTSARSRFTHGRYDNALAITYPPREIQLGEVGRPGKSTCRICHIA